MKLEPGALVQANLRLSRRIGEGGMGAVWVAEHLALETEVAIKFMAPELATMPDMVERFTREARAAAQMRSPHVVRIFDYAVPAEGVPYMVMELLEGEDLETRVSKRGRLEIGEAIAVVTQLAKALGEAHSLGIVHRDVKPENVFLTSCGGEPFVKVLDFGIAKTRASARALPRVTCSGTTIGTPIYMSPEQILSAKDVDYRCDLWALAVVAYYCLTGRVPFEGETYGAVCIAIDRGAMRAPSALRAEVPKEVDAWFARALARDIERRFRSAQEMADALVAAFGETASRGARAPSSFARIAAWRPAVRRHRTLSAATVTRVVPGGAAHARSRVATFASLVATAFLVLGALDVARAWLARPVRAAAATPFTAPALATATQVTSAIAPPLPCASAGSAPHADDAGALATKATVAPTALEVGGKRAPLGHVLPATTKDAESRPLGL
jgi:serine/threonine-protein kinase